MPQSDSRTGRRIGRIGVFAFALGGPALFGLVMHCGNFEEGSVFDDQSACATIYKDKCGSPCTEDLNCPDGLYCAGNGKCFADCASAGPACADGITCSPRGRCGSDNPTPLGDGSAADVVLTDACAEVEVTLTKIKPTIILLVDQSGSMTAEFPSGSGVSRWDVLRDALMDPDGGIIKTLQDDVSFGLTLYTWPRDTPTCPQLLSVPTSFNNYAAMQAVYGPAVPLDNTPTAESIMGVVGFNDAGTLLDAGFASTVTEGPKFILLATDGDPDTCAAPDSNGQKGPRDFTVWATRRTFDAGIRTYVMAIGADIDEGHQQQVANAGLGFDPDAGDAAPLFRTNNRDQVVQALNEIIVGARSCKFTLNSAVRSGTEGLGTVKLNGERLVLNDPNGWKLNSPTELEITGTSCTTVKTAPTAQVSVRFPCGVVIPK